MPEPDARLGVTFDANKLFYAVSPSARPAVVERIGQIHFSHDLVESIVYRDPDTFPGLCDTINKIAVEEDVSEIKMVFPPILECWTIVPKIVYDQEDERETHLGIIMQGMNPSRIKPEWHSLSNRDFKMLSLRRKDHLDSFSFMLNGPVNGRLCSDFQIGELWMERNKSLGSFLCVSSYEGLLSISSFLLGKLRAATYISYDDISDIPYLWLQYSSHLLWMLGMHEQVLVFGHQSGEIVENLHPYWDEASEIIIMDSPEKMNVKSEEKTFSFPLERAFSATLLSIC